MSLSILAAALFGTCPEMYQLYHAHCCSADDGAIVANTTCLHLRQSYNGGACCASPDATEPVVPYTLLVGVGYGPLSNEAIYGVPILDEELRNATGGAVRARLFTEGPRFAPVHIDDGTIDAALMPASFALGFPPLSQMVANGLATAYSSMSVSDAEHYFLEEADGKSAYEAVYSGSGMVGFATLNPGPEAFGWSKTEITSLADMQSMQGGIRVPGGLLFSIYNATLFPANVIGTDGSAVVASKVLAGTYDFWEWNSAYADIGALSAAEPAVEASLKRGDYYKHHYTPHLHQGLTFNDLIFTHESFARVPAAHRDNVKLACKRSVPRFSALRAAAIAATEANIAQGLDGWTSGAVTLHRTIPSDITAAFRTNARALLDGIDDPGFQAELAKFRAYASRRSLPLTGKYMNNLKTTPYFEYNVLAKAVHLYKFHEVDGEVRLWHNHHECVEYEYHQSSMTETLSDSFLCVNVTQVKGHSRMRINFLSSEDVVLREALRAKNTTHVEYLMSTRPNTKRNVFPVPAHPQVFDTSQAGELFADPSYFGGPPPGEFSRTILEYTYFFEDVISNPVTFYLYIRYAWPSSADPYWTTYYVGTPGGVGDHDNYRGVLVYEDIPLEDTIAPGYERFLAGFENEERYLLVS